MLEIAEAGNISWDLDAINGAGNISATGLFTSDKVGTWFINISSASGANASTTIIVGHGQIDRLLIEPSNFSITADDIVWLNTTRVDIRGNELPVELPQSAWSVQSGLLNNGTPATWQPKEVGNRWIKGTLEGVSKTVYISVAHGAMQEMIIEKTQSRNGSDTTMLNDNMTTDEVDKVVLRSWGVDSKENRWTIEATWSLSANEAFATICVTRTASSCYFEADVVMLVPYQMRATYTPADSTDFFSSLIYFNVSHGLLDSMELSSDQGLSIELSVDEKIERAKLFEEVFTGR